MTWRRVGDGRREFSGERAPKTVASPGLAQIAVLFEARRLV